VTGKIFQENRRRITEMAERVCFALVANPVCNNYSLFIGILGDLHEYEPTSTGGN
jgi:hypothetical protein